MVKPLETYISLRFGLQDVKKTRYDFLKCLYTTRKFFHPSLPCSLIVHAEIWFWKKLQETFAEYTARTAFERPLLSGVAYAQRVVNSERLEFERQHGWTIKTMEREPSPIRDEYAPVIFSQETVSYIESLDMMSGEVTFWVCDLNLDPFFTPFTF